MAESEINLKRAGFIKWWRDHRFENPVDITKVEFFRFFESGYRIEKELKGSVLPEPYVDPIKLDDGVIKMEFGYESKGFVGLPPLYQMYYLLLIGDDPNRDMVEVYRQQVDSPPRWVYGTRHGIESYHSKLTDTVLDRTTAHPPRYPAGYISAENRDFTDLEKRRIMRKVTNSMEWDMFQSPKIKKFKNE